METNHPASAEHPEEVMMPEHHPFPKLGARRRGLAALAAVLACGAGALAAGPAQAATPPHAVASVPFTKLDAVSALSPRNVWAVGCAVDVYERALTTPGCRDVRTGQPIIEHWDGTSWSLVPSPNPGNGALTGVKAVSADNVWAVGQDTTSSGTTQTLIEHYNGTSWTQVPSPSPGATVSELNAVSSTSATSAWAVGNYSDSSGASHSLILHWNGASWTQVPSPTPAVTQTFYLTGVSAVSASNAWASGFYNAGQWLPLILHWNGTRWTQVPSPNPGGYGSLLEGLSADSGHDAWTAGAYINTAGNFATMVMHGTRTSWTQVKVPNPYFGGRPNGEAGLFGISARSATDAWATGWYSRWDLNRTQPLIVHWDGKSWTRASLPSLNPNMLHVLWGISADSAGDAWAVGTQVNFSPYSGQSLILHWNGTSWAQVPGA